MDQHVPTGGRGLCSGDCGREPRIPPPLHRCCVGDRHLGGRRLAHQSLGVGGGPHGAWVVRAGGAGPFESPLVGPDSVDVWSRDRCRGCGRSMGGEPLECPPRGSGRPGLAAKTGRTGPHRQRTSRPGTLRVLHGLGPKTAESRRADQRLWAPIHRRQLRDPASRRLRTQPIDAPVAAAVRLAARGANALLAGHRCERCRVRRTLGGILGGRGVDFIRRKIRDHLSARDGAARADGAAPRRRLARAMGGAWGHRRRTGSGRRGRVDRPALARRKRTVGRPSQHQDRLGERGGDRGRLGLVRNGRRGSVDRLRAPQHRPGGVAGTL